MSAEKPPITKDQGFIFSDIAKSPKRAIAKTAEARVRMTTKSALQWYISQYFNSDGIYRNTLELTAPFSLSYVTDISGNITSEDPSVYNIQLARMWKGLQEKLPAIIIADTSYEYKYSGLGGQEPGTLISQYKYAARACMQADLTIDMVVVSMDETTTSDIADALTYIFGPLTSINKSWLLRSMNPEDQWEVRLPMAGISPSGLERRNITDDPVDSCWSTTLSCNVSFEGLVAIGFNSQINPDQRQAVNSGYTSSPVEGQGVYPQCGLGTPSDFMYLDYKVPERVYLGRPFPIQYNTMPSFSAFISDNPEVAIIDENSIIHPKRPGKFNLLVINSRPGASPGPYTVLQTHEIPVEIL